MDMREVAFDLAAQGFKVFPLREKGKLPIQGLSWRGLVCQDEMAAWDLWTQPQFRNSNVGIHCEGLIVVDVDDYKAKAEGAADALVGLDLPATFAVRTARGGRHLYFTGPDVANSASKIAPGIDVRGGNGYVVGPGSVTEDGVYEVIDAAPLSRAPQALVDRCNAGKESQHRDTVEWGALTSAARLEDGRQFLSTARISVEGCGGNHTAFAVISELWDKGVSAQGAVDLLMEEGGWNDRCLPPWSADELHTLIHNVYTYAKNEFGCRAADNIFGHVVIPVVDPPEDDWQVISAASWQDQPIPPRKWYIEDWVPANNVTLLYGDGAVGKSLAALQLAAAGVAGGGWFGLKVEQPGPVLMLMAEDEPEETHARLWEVIKPFGRFSNYRDLHIVSRAGLDAGLAKFDREGNMLATDIWPKLVREIQTIRPKLVVLDNLADIFLGDEIHKQQARAFINLLRGVCITLDTTIIVLAHPSQAGMESGRGTSGNTAWSNSVRSRLYMERDLSMGGDGKPDKNMRLLTVMKANYSAAGIQLRVRWNEGRFVITAPSADVQAERNKDLARLVYCYMRDEVSVAKVPILEVAKALVGKNHDLSRVFREANGSNAQARAYLASVIAGGVELDDDRGGTVTLNIEGDFVVY
jgi:RecA-family ATPase